LQKQKPETELSLDSYIVPSKRQRKPSKAPDALGNS
jgi:regulator of nonsense transcripts 2